MVDPLSPQDEQFDRRLRREPEHCCFHESIPRVTSLQATGAMSPQTRSYWAKYPGETGGCLRRLTYELLTRLDTAQRDTLVSEEAPHADTPVREEGKVKGMWATWKVRRTA
jgi:chromosome partitioning protein